MNKIKRHFKNKAKIIKLFVPMAILGIVGLVVFYSVSNKNSKNGEQFVSISGLSDQEISFLMNAGFLPAIQGEKEELTIADLKAPGLVEQNLNSPNESFEVLAAKLDSNNYQLAFKLENKSEQDKEFYLIPVSKESQLEFKEIKGVVNNENTISINKEDARKEPLNQLYDVEKHKKELKPELAKAYDDIKNNNYQPSPIKITLGPKSTLLAQSQWQIKTDRGRASDNLEPVYFLVQGSAGGAKEEFEDEVSLKKVQQKYEQATEIKAKYQQEGASLKRIVKDDPKDRIEVLVGNKDAAEFSPDLKIARWDDEVNMVIKPKNLDKITTKDKDLKFEGEKIKFETPKIDYHLYELTEGEGGYEFEVLLKEKPATNKIEFTLNTKGVDFFYQPPLTQEYQNGYSEEFQKEIVVSETQVKDLDGNVLVDRPDNVVGSYAVYASEQKTNWTGGKLYRTGQMGMIYRPKITDAEGNWSWEELNIENGILTITIPQDFLDKAVYPISSKGTNFGYDTLGSSTIYLAADVARSNGVAYSPAGNGVANSMNFGGVDSGELVKLAIYLTDGTRVGDTGTNAGTIPASQDWVGNINISGTVNVYSASSYYLVAKGNTSNSGWAYNSGGDGAKYFANDYDDAFPDSVTWSTGTARLYSIYATYTPAGGTAALTGTAVPNQSITETDVVTGGKTIIITLTGDTWVATVGQDNAITTALIAGIDSAQSEDTGWDDVVKAHMVFGDVVRTSNTVVTVTLGDEATYDITATETITVTIPATAVTLAAQIVATPTFTVTAVGGAGIKIQNIILNGIKMP